VLFLDELAEFARSALEALREPLESGSVAVSRAALQNHYPAAFQLIAAMNPCPCGHLGDPVADCRCTPAQVRGYRGRISGPLLDRLDMHVEFSPLTAREFAAAERVPGETTAAAAAHIVCARRVQLTRQGTCNARLSDADVQRWCRMDTATQQLLAEAMQRLGLSGRARQRVLKLARTIADLAAASAIGAGHITEALTLRCLDRRGATAPSAPCDRPPA
jgi:magnesium chelatase family protein